MGKGGEFRQRLEEAEFTTEQAQVVAAGLTEGTNEPRALTPAGRLWLRRRICWRWCFIGLLVLTETVLCSVMVCYEKLPEPLSGGTFALMLIAVVVALPLFIAALYDDIVQKRRQLDGNGRKHDNPL